MTEILFYITLAAVAIYAVFKFLYELHMLQQNSYRNERFTRWLKGNYGSADRGLEVIFLVFNLLITFLYAPVGLVLVTLSFVFLSWRFYNKEHKKALVLTDRAKRILGLSLFLFFCISLSFMYFFGICVIEEAWIGNRYCFSSDVTDFAGKAIKWMILGLVLAFISTPITILLANTLLIPYEKYNHNWYINDAKKMLASMPNLTIIGITGSYGKTSTKHFLHSILAQKYNVIMTPGSFNTPMGVVRTVREQLKPFHEVFIVEMGAKQIGDIKEICDIAHPTIGILTAVGAAHLETFKTVENIRKTKFELIDSLPQNGFAVLNADYEIILNQEVNKPKSYYGVKNSKAQFSIEDVIVNARGSSFSVNKDGKNYGSFETKLLGEHNLSNLAAAVAVAAHLNMPAKSISVGIKKLQPVTHRLSIRRIGSGITILDDAFNSNPVGAKMAVEVLGQMEGSRKIIVTPGMVELGDKTYELNKAFGTQIAQNADIAIVVGKTNSEAITDGLKAGHFPEIQIYHAIDFKDATTWLGGRMTAGDVILYENDLPDSYK
ncbi:MAG: UDP-N-acetylmuramoyl-tripeptide--D-alanyl-D-alanine ligase [Saprospiraceae bacterium]|jgi:UDP-N-acetylmuramoyl-tripeptide--D-alanyl-D-alanine ligase